MFSGYLDIFKQPVTLYLKQRDNRNEYDNLKGSIYGTIMTFVLFGTCIGYFNAEFNKMMNFEYDEQIQKKVVNTFTMDNEFYLSETKFLPMLELIYYGSPEKQQLFKMQELGLDLNKLEVGQTIKPDLEMMSKFLDFALVYRERKNGMSTRIRYNLRYCVEEDFTKRGYMFETEYQKELVLRRLCPDVDSMKSMIKIKNGYSNQNDRGSFSLEIYQCNIENCAIRDKIKEMLSLIQFNIYYLQQDVEYANPENEGHDIIHSSDIFHSQFVLQVDNYRDNNNFLVPHKMKMGQSRFSVFERAHSEQHFFQLISRPIWQGSKRLRTYNISSNNGLTYSSIQYEQLSGTYFFLADHKKILSNHSFSILDLGSKIGGLAAVLYKGFYFVAMFINENVILNIIIKHLYFVNNKQYCTKNRLNRSKMKQFSQIHISALEYLLLPCKNLCRKRGKNRNQHFFAQAKKRVEKDLDIINLIKTVRKLKAGLSAIVNNDQKILKKTKEIYMHGASIFSECSSDEDDHFGNQFLEFILTDEKEKLEDINVKICIENERSDVLLKISKSLREKFTKRKLPNQNFGKLGDISNNGETSINSSPIVIESRQIFAEEETKQDQSQQRPDYNKVSQTLQSILSIESSSSIRIDQTIEDIPEIFLANSKEQ